MILTGDAIQEAVSSGDITIAPFNKSNITTNSYDLFLGDSYIRYLDEVLDPKKKPTYETLRIGKDGLVLKKGDFILCSSKETIGSRVFVPIIHARSGIARLGLFVHVTADLIDVGSVGNVTFQLYATRTIRIYPGMRIAQASFWKTVGTIIPYDGKYKNSQGPKASLMYSDFDDVPVDN